MFLDILISTIAFRKEVEEFFDEMDRDFDGRLSFSEFMGEETLLLVDIFVVVFNAF